MVIASSVIESLAGDALLFKSKQTSEASVIAGNCNTTQRTVRRAKGGGGGRERERVGASEEMRSPHLSSSC